MRGGKRIGAGPKFLPKGELKKQVIISIEQDFIDEWGGRKKMQKDVRAWIYQQLIIKNTNIINKLTFK